MTKIDARDVATMSDEDFGKLMDRIDEGEELDFGRSPDVEPDGWRFPADVDAREKPGDVSVWDLTADEFEVLYRAALGDDDARVIIKRRFPTLQRLYLGEGD